MSSAISPDQQSVSSATRDMTARSDEFRRRSRRRGRALEESIFEAALAELSEYGFAGMSLERVAERAGTGKSAIYRRWGDKLELVVDTLAHAITEPAPVTSSGNLRDDLLGYFRQLARALAGPAGTAILANVGQAQQHPELRAAVRERFTESGQGNLRILFLAGVERGEVRPGALTPECLDAGPALLRHRFFEQGPAVPDEVIVSIVDNVVIPMVRP